MGHLLPRSYHTFWSSIRPRGVQEALSDAPYGVAAAKGVFWE
jgi:hypothetical protein